MPNNAALQLPCSDPERTKRFFVEQLGFQCTKNFNDVFVVAKDGIEISYWKVSPPEEAGTLAQQADYYVRVGNLNALFHQLGTRELDFEATMERQPSGTFELHISDPDGNRIRFIE